MENEQHFNFGAVQVGQTCILIETMYGRSTYRTAFVEKVTQTTVHIRHSEAPQLTHIFNRRTGRIHGGGYGGNVTRRVVGDYNSERVRQGYREYNEKSSAEDNARSAYRKKLQEIRETISRLNMNAARMHLEGDTHTDLVKAMKDCANLHDDAVKAGQIAGFNLSGLYGVLSSEAQTLKAKRIREHVTTCKEA